MHILPCTGHLQCLGFCELLGWAGRTLHPLHAPSCCNSHPKKRHHASESASAIFLLQPPHLMSSCFTDNPANTMNDIQFRFCIPFSSGLMFSPDRLFDPFQSPNWPFLISPHSSFPSKSFYVPSI